MAILVTYFHDVCQELCILFQLPYALVSYELVISVCLVHFNYMDVTTDVILLPCQLVL